MRPLPFLLSFESGPGGLLFLTLPSTSPYDLTSLGIFLIQTACLGLFLMTFLCHRNNQPQLARLGLWTLVLCAVPIYMFVINLGPITR